MIQTLTLATVENQNSKLQDRTPDLILSFPLPMGISQLNAQWSTKRNGANFNQPCQPKSFQSNVRYVLSTVALLCTCSCATSKNLSFLLFLSIFILLFFYNLVLG